MSTKNLARTVIEGGRYRANAVDRRHSNAEERRATHVVERAACRDPDAFEDALWPVRDHVRKSFHDRLGAAERWLASQVGRSWNRVRAEIAERFDTRTIAGQHIVFDHLLPDWRDRDGRWRVNRRWTFRVDRHGILRFAPPRWPRWERPPFVDAREESAIRAWAAGRRVITRGRKIYWLMPVVREFVGTRYRQDRALDEAETRTWASFSALARALIELLDPSSSRE